MNYCLFCKKELSRGQTKYCNASCQQQHYQEIYIENWQQGIENGLKADYQISDRVRHYMLAKANYKCEQCGWGEINPYTNSIPLELHHKNGNWEETTEDNLIVLCPNCHSLTENYRSRGKGRTDRSKYYMTNQCIDCGITIANTSTRCKECNIKFRREEHIKTLPVTREELKILLRNKPFTEIAKMFNVSDSGVKRWCDSFELPNTKTQINSYSDKEWENI